MYMYMYSEVMNSIFLLVFGILPFSIILNIFLTQLIQAKILQNQKDVGRLLQSTMERSNQRFPLSDILPVPIQRMLRYPLLIKELEKNSRKSAMPSQNQVVQLEKLLVFLEVRCPVCLSVCLIHLAI